MSSRRYRAWDKENNRMLEWDEIKACSLFWICKENDSYEFFQSTGLTDCVGLEVYEGDLIKTISGDIQEVRYNNKQAMFGLWAGGIDAIDYWTVSLDYAIRNGWRVVGNIRSKVIIN